MHRHRELVHSPPLFQLIAALTEDLQIPCQGGTVAAHIYDPFRLHFQHGIKTGSVAALPWRIHHDHIRKDPFLLILLRQYFFCLADEKFRITDLVSFCILPGILNGLRNDLHPVNLLCLC